MQLEGAMCILQQEVIYCPYGIFFGNIYKVFV